MCVVCVCMYMCVCMCECVCVCAWVCECVYACACIDVTIHTHPMHVSNYGEVVHARGHTPSHSHQAVGIQPLIIALVMVEMCECGVDRGDFKIDQHGECVCVCVGYVCMCVCVCYVRDERGNVSVL